MKLNLKKLSAMALLVTSLAAMPLAVTASGIPVVDGAAAAQRAQNFLQQMMEMAKQLAQMTKFRPSGARFIKAQKISTISL